MNRMLIKSIPPIYVLSFLCCVFSFPVLPSSITHTHTRPNTDTLSPSFPRSIFLDFFLSLLCHHFVNHNLCFMSTRIKATQQFFELNIETRTKRKQSKIKLTKREKRFNDKIDVVTSHLLRTEIILWLVLVRIFVFQNLIVFDFVCVCCRYCYVGRTIFLIPLTRFVCVMNFHVIWWCGFVVFDQMLTTIVIRRKSNGMKLYSTLNESASDNKIWINIDL